MYSILVITSLPDPHIEMVKKHLGRDVNFVVFDPRALAMSGSFTLSSDGLLSALEDLEPISVWYRKPKFVQETEMAKMGIPTDFFLAISSLHEEGFSLINEAYSGSAWVSKPSAIKKASNKLLQIMVAKKIGFAVPETIFSTDPVEVEKLRGRVGNIVMKPLGRPFANINGIPSWFFATVIPNTQAMDYEGLGLTPIIFQ